MSRNPHKNKLKTAVAITLASVFAVIAAIIAIATVQKDEPVSNNTQPISGQQEAVSEITGACGTNNGACTKAEVAVHNNKNDCWVIYKSNYYNVTDYVSKHPGGSSMFNNDTCGKDIEDFLNGNAETGGRSNNHSTSAYKELEKYKVGPVQP